MNDILLEKNSTALKDFIAALMEPMQTRTDDLKNFETEQTKRAKFNGQKIVLQAALNDLFGITSAPFIIVETNRNIGSNLYFYEPSEDQPVYFAEPSENDPIYFFEPGELTVTDYDFIVHIPSGIWTAELERRIKAQTMIYKLAGPKVIFDTY